MRTCLISWEKVLFGMCLLLVGMSALYFIYVNKLNSPVIRSDGEGYYAYLPAVFIYHDITLRDLVAGPLHGNVPQGAHYWESTTKYLIKYPSGEAILMAPFFVIAWISHYIFRGGIGIDGYSKFFQYAAAFSGLFYTVMGLLILWCVLQRYYRRNTILLVLMGLTFGTNLFHYATYDAIFSHAYSFFLLTAFLFFVEQIYRKKTITSFIASGVIGGLIFITRPSNVIWLLFGILYGINSKKDILDRLIFYKKHKKKLLLFLIAFISIISIQFLYWKSITGSFTVYSYGNESFNWTRPEISNVLFSVKKGLFFWAPILLTLIPGIFFIKKKTKEYFIPIVVFFPLNVFVISSWYCWWYGGSYGHRAFTESIPMHAIALCALYEGINSRWGRRFLITIIVLACILSIWLMLKYWYRSIPFEGPTWDALISNFFELKPSSR